MSDVFEWLPYLAEGDGKPPKLLADKWTIEIAKDAATVRMMAARKAEVSEEELPRLQIAVRFCGTLQ